MAEPKRSAKVWAHRDGGGKYYILKWDDGTKERIEFLEGLSTQQSLIVLQDAMEKKIGEPCSLAIMNKLAIFDERDGLSEEQVRKLAEGVRRAKKVPSEH